MRIETDAAPERRTIPLTLFIAEARNDALLHSHTGGCRFAATVVDPSLEISGDHTRLLAALENLLQNAFKFSQINTEVTLTALWSLTAIHKQSAGRSVHHGIRRGWRHE